MFGSAGELIHGGCLVYYGTLTWFWQAHQSGCSGWLGVSSIRRLPIRRLDHTHSIIIQLLFNYYVT